MTVANIARVCHELNKAYCESIGDYSQKSWDNAERWQRDSAIKGVEFALQNENAPVSSQHDAWMADKLKDGWAYGEIKNADMKTHPCIVPYDKLPYEQKAKDYIFKQAVISLKPFLD